MIAEHSREAQKRGGTKRGLVSTSTAQLPDTSNSTKSRISVRTASLLAMYKTPGCGQRPRLPQKPRPVCAADLPGATGHGQSVSNGPPDGKSQRCLFFSLRIPETAGKGRREICQRIHPALALSVAPNCRALFAVVFLTAENCHQTATSCRSGDQLPVGCFRGHMNWGR